MNAFLISMRIPVSFYQNIFNARLILYNILHNIRVKARPSRIKKHLYSHVIGCECLSK